MNRRTLIVISVMLWLAAGASILVGEGAAYPTKPITLVVSFPPGGGADTVGRPLASVAYQHLGQPMVVINKAGGG